MWLGDTYARRACARFGDLILPHDLEFVRSVPKPIFFDICRRASLYAGATSG